MANPFSNAIRQINATKRQAIQQIVNKLAEDGERICKEAARTKETASRSYNQLDAFGYAVYSDGKLVKKGYAAPEQSKKQHKGWAKKGIPADTGRGYLDKFFQDHKAPANRFQLVVVNAIYYTKILEDGKGFGGAKYKIITQIGDDMYKLQEQYGGRIDVISPV